MYRYDEFDAAFVAGRTAQFADQVKRRLSGELSEEQFRPLRLMNGLYLQLHAYMLRIAVPYGTLSSRQMRCAACYTIVPGVSAALAAAADTATPVTLRNVSSGFVMATAHGADDGDLRHWAALARSGLTLALYMGKSVASDVAKRLVENGASAALPVGIVVNAGRSTMTTYSGNLQSLIEHQPDLAEGPAIIFVGEAIAAGDWGKGAQVAAERFKVA